MTDIEKKINQGYRVYNAFKGFRLNDAIQQKYLDYFDLVVEFDQKNELIFVRDAKSKDRIQTSK
jgi:hypothetical protein